MHIFFYIFALLAILSSIMTICCKNPVHAVLYLIFTFVNIASTMVLIGAEYFGMLLIIVYVGAIAVLFLCVVMMLDIKISEVKPILGKFSAIPILCVILLLANLIYANCNSKIITSNIITDTTETNHSSNVKLIGNELYTKYAIPFQATGLILFIAMIGTILLNIKKRDLYRTQNAPKQIQHNKENSMEIKKVDFGKAIKDIKYED